MRPEHFDKLSTAPVEGPPPALASGSGSRPTPVTGRLRLVRAVTLGGASMVLATGAHLLGGGQLPSVAVLLISTLLVGLTAVTLTGRRCRLPLLTAALGLEQLVLHLVLSAGAGPVGLVAGGSGHAAMSTLVPTGHAAMAEMSPLMLTLHLLATLATAWLLARGEQWLWRLADRAVRAASWTPVLRRRRCRPLRLVPVRVRITARSWTTEAPRGPPATYRFA